MEKTIKVAALTYFNAVIFLMIGTLFIALPDIFNFNQRNYFYRIMVLLLTCLVLNGYRRAILKLYGVKI